MLRLLLIPASILFSEAILHGQSPSELPGKYIRAAAKAIFTAQPDTLVNPATDYIFTDYVFNAAFPDDPTYLLRINDSLTSELWAVIKQDSGYFAFPLIKKPARSYEVDVVAGCEFQVDTINIDDKGNPELVIHWFTFRKYEFETTGDEQQDSGMCIWNLDRMEMIFDFQYYHRYFFWQFIFKDTTVGPDGWPPIEGVDYDSSSYYYNVTVSLKKIIIEKLIQSGADREAGSQPKLHPNPIIYDWKSQGFLRRRPGT
jgi:hypothetical protein